MKDPLDYTHFGETLRLARVKLGLPSTRVVGEAIGVKGGQILSWEAGTKFPPEELLPRIAEVYKLDLSEVIADYKTSKEIRERFKAARKAPVSRKSRVLDEIVAPGSVVAEISSITKGFRPMRNAYGAYKGGKSHIKW